MAVRPNQVRVYVAAQCVLMLVLSCWSPFFPVALHAAPLACEDGTQSSGATYRICMPEQWNKRLVVYAHGYVAPTEPVGIPETQMRLPGSNFTVDQFVTSQGYAFATSGYSTNGLAIQEGIADLLDVVAIFKAQKGTPEKVILAGVSEGGAITALALEQHADVFDGGLAMCGPYGSFREQINYFGDFRVLFDHFLPGVLPPSAIEIPSDLLTTWETSYYTNTVQPALTAITNTTAIDQLLAVSNAPFDANDSTSKLQSIKDLLWYNVFATNDAKVKLGGHPFDNIGHRYGQTVTDPAIDLQALNQAVARFGADQAALTALGSYETTGRLTKPLITLHTTGDPIVPFWHATEYTGKTLAADNLAQHEQITVQAYGHCRFSTFDVLGAFNRLVTLIDNPPVYQPVQHAYLPITAR